MDSRAVTNYLRGIAIILVMVIHFAGLYGQSYIPFELNIYSSQIVYCFIILSGHGIYFSLRMRLGAGESKGRTLLPFYTGRGTMIYPIFWLALLFSIRRAADEAALPAVQRAGAHVRQGTED